jgi:hypothetical protein
MFKRFCFISLILLHGLTFQQGLTSSSTKESCPDVASYKVGDFAQGGVVIWVTEDGKHGLVAAITDAGAALRWGTPGIIGANRTSSLPFTYTKTTPAANYSGYQNQQIIERLTKWESRYPAFFAAKNYFYEVDDIKYEGWFLPSIKELAMMYVISDKIDKISAEKGGDRFEGKLYWSSREYGNTLAWNLDFSSGSQNLNFKDYPYAVRCLRAF